ncbi:hypothetical protein [Nocardia amamiensis]|uniref:hypothetical protein n=1 Tax=Nocardia amamiensis TaxID=404578 RepID=UPI000B0E6526|nr:hypothetical protein [Nocardia amamiensis]
MRRLLLSLPTLGERQLLLCELDGHAELLVAPDDPEVVRRLLGRVLREPSGAEVDADGLLCVWRDRVFAALFERELGGRVASQARCSACNEDYAFGFDLAAVVRQQDSAAAATGLVADDDGRVVVEHGTRLRPPTVGDVVAHRDPDSLARALADPTLPRERVEEILDEVAPLLSFDLETRCAHCEQPQVLRFDVVRYTLESLAAERPLLIREIHLIASRYGWGHDTVMGLTRADRRAYAALILSERNATGLRSVG